MGKDFEVPLNCDVLMGNLVCESSVCEEQHNLDTAVFKCCFYDVVQS